MRYVVSLITVLPLFTGCVAGPFEDGAMLPSPEALDTSGRSAIIDPIIPHVEDDCGTLSAEPANTTVVYDGPLGIRFSVPYNEKWGSGNTRLQPYSESVQNDLGQEVVLFGPPQFTPGEGLPSCNVVHSYEMTVLPPQSADQAMRRIRNEGLETGITPEAKVRTINGLTVVQYSPPGLCFYPTLEVIGATHNYSFSMHCGLGVEEEWKYLEDIVKTVELGK